VIIKRESGKISSRKHRSHRLCRMAIKREKVPLIRVAIAGDHNLFRESLCALLEFKGGFCVVGQGSNEDEALHVAHTSKPDILLLDLSVPQKSSREVMRELNDSGLSLRVIVLTDFISKSDTFELLHLGAKGVVLKNSGVEILLEAIHKVMAGEYWINRDELQILIEAATESPVEVGPKNSFGLTARELEITAAVVQAYSNREIAEKFSLSEQTVKHHLTHIFDKLGVYSRLELALFAADHGLVQAS
jgi:two-component system nitrate/nitrite response regulator NarL